MARCRWAVGLAFRQQFAAPFRVPIEAAGGEHDAQRGGHVPRGRTRLEHRAGDGPVFGSEVLHLGSEQDVDAARAERGQEATDQRIAHDEP